MDSSSIAGTATAGNLAAAQSQADSDKNNAAQQQAAAQNTSATGQTVGAVTQSTRRLVDIFA